MQTATEEDAWLIFAKWHSEQTPILALLQLGPFSLGAASTRLQIQNSPQNLILGHVSGFAISVPRDSMGPYGFMAEPHVPEQFRGSLENHKFVSAVQVAIMRSLATLVLAHFEVV